MNNIKELRDKAGKTQSDLAAELGITQGAVAHYEKSRRKPGLNTCRKIASVINNWGVQCSINDVFPPENC
ncbi:MULTISPECIES: helix-turn-helix transcriptional regulator [Aeromonas]|jgi:putative transcriptional regulator|uniref:helix-turn-helix transcriptional regulator n=1 Tax=Aeromonas veronii TaxID=654 RepID=UPI00226CC1FA|nr:helix-turn-helix transcriptional regulator [Aeromonas veronii]MCX9104027.1 helix-turn-helix domain-containing protein [Aeromonas veronii]MCX9119678.1 helix-turn-helix domain-containing protein [Aeromonas veronii]